MPSPLRSPSEGITTGGFATAGSRCAGRGGQLSHALGADQVTKRTAAEVDQPRVRGERFTDEIPCRAGHQRLASVGELAYPGRAVDRRPHVVAFIAQLHFTGVHADSQPDGCQAGLL
jgi:hypothetical protein